MRREQVEELRKQFGAGVEGLTVEQCVAALLALDEREALLAALRDAAEALEHFSPGTSDADDARAAIAAAEAP